MNKEEVKLLLVTIPTFYPNFKVDNEMLTVNAWLSVLEDCTSESISKALKTYVREGHEFAPNPGQLIQKAFEMIHADEYMEDGEAKALLEKAIHNGIYGAKDSFEKFPPLLQKAVGSPNIISELAVGRIDDVDDACNRIIYSYRTLVDRDKKQRTMSPDVKAYIAAAKDNLAIEDKGGKDV